MTGLIRNIRGAGVQLAFAVALLAAGAPAPAQSPPSPVVIKFSHVVTVDTPKGKAVERFRQLAYPNSSLYKDQEEREALQLGAVQMLAPSLSKHTGYAAVTNKAFWDGPPPDLQAVVAVDQGRDHYELKRVAEDNAAALAQIKAAGKVDVLVLTAALRAEWKKTLWPVHKEMESRVGAALLASVCKSAGSNPP